MADSPGPAAVRRADIIVYGGTSAAVMAAVQAQRLGMSVLIISPDKHLGGLSSSGLGFTDTGNKEVIGGLAREFYQRLYQFYQHPEAWRWQKPSEYGNAGQGTPAIDGANRTQWIFEPHAAEQVFEDFVKEHKLTVYRGEWLDRGPGGVVKQAGTIRSVRTLSGQVYEGRMFIDATYEGDLMAAAGVSYHIGREATSIYGEKWNGVQPDAFQHRHHFAQPISAYVVPGDPRSGLLPEISADAPGAKGSGDKRIQAYCFRLCLTNQAENRVPFTKPTGYDPARYALLARLFAIGWRETFDKFDPIPNYKTDTNNHGPFNMDYIGQNYDYPEASYAQRQRIVQAHETYQKGMLYFLANDGQVPADVRAKMQQWGLAKDEFQDNNHWPRQLYIREARRLRGQFVMTETHALAKTPVPEPIGMGSYALDSHNAQRYVTPEGLVQNEGDVGVEPDKPYGIAYGAILPQEKECNNLLVPVCVSSSHIAYGSMRMEPVFMILGQSAATAAVLAIRNKVSPQQLPYAQLRTALLKSKQRLELAP